MIRVVHMPWIEGVKVDRSIDRYDIIEIETSISGRAQHSSITSSQLEHSSITSLHHYSITCFPFSSSAWLKILFSMVTSQPWKERQIIIFLFIISLVTSLPCIPITRWNSNILTRMDSSSFWFLNFYGGPLKSYCNCHFPGN
jgi:hypothetical protein